MLNKDCLYATYEEEVFHTIRKIPDHTNYRYDLREWHKIDILGGVSFSTTTYISDTIWTVTVESAYQTDYTNIIDDPNAPWILANKYPLVFAAACFTDYIINGFGELRPCLYDAIKELAKYFETATKCYTNTDTYYINVSVSSLNDVEYLYDIFRSSFSFDSIISIGTKGTTSSIIKEFLDSMP